MKILKADEIRYLDKYTIEQENISSIDLMERAAIAFSLWFEKNIDKTIPVKIFAGLRNNGGDALAIARLLSLKRYDVEIYIIRYSPKMSEDFDKNYVRLKNRVTIKDIWSEDNLPDIPETSVVIDGILGSGLNRNIEGIIKYVIDHINISKCEIISVDIPSGLHSDREPDANQTIIRANYTITFQFPKLAFMFDENEKYVGKWIRVDIGLSKMGIDKINTPYNLLKIRDLENILKERPNSSHKGNFGHALMIAGSYGKIGAAILAGRAALRAGLGMLTMYVPSCGYSIIQTAVPEAICLVDQNDKYWSKPVPPSYYTTLGIGPGLGRHPQTGQAFVQTLQQLDKPIVLDADALNILSENKEFISYIPKNSILTPHFKEFDNLAAGKQLNGYQHLEMITQLSQNWQVYIVLKGHYTAIATPKGDVYFNTTGNPGMATAGSGDVLTGILVGLLSQGYSALETCLLGVYLHGLAGNFAYESTHQNTLIASDIIDNMYKAFTKIEQPRVTNI